MKIAVLLLYLTAYGILSVYLLVDAAHSSHCLSHVICFLIFSCSLRGGESN